MCVCCVVEHRGKQQDVKTNENIENIKKKVQMKMVVKGTKSDTTSTQKYDRESEMGKKL